jgi:hypothetical protein
MLNLVAGSLILIRKEMFRPKCLTMVKLFTNQKEVDRAIQAAVDQYEKYRRHSSLKRKRNRKNRTKNKRS